jgi:RNA polymerase sigma-70 factor (ECF subfamily)
MMDAHAAVWSSENGVTLPKMTYTTLSDEGLMLRYRDDDVAAFEVLYDRHKGGLYRYFLRHVDNHSDAQELSQEVWRKLIKARKHYTDRAKFSTYLYHIAHNRLVDYFKTSSGDQIVDLDPEAREASPWDDPEHRVLAEELAWRIGELVRCLPPEQREAWVLKEDAGLSIEEIAESTGVGIETVKSRLRYALDKLKRGLGDYL